MSESFPMYHNRRWGEKLGDKASTPLTLQSLEVKTVINSDLPDLSITTTTMTFINNHDKTLEGALEFELPEDAVVCGFGLDLDGGIVDGVVVDKEKARVAFEAAVREGKSAAIAEAVVGNIFKNRVYPIHAGGTRQVRLSYQDKPQSTAGGDLVYSVPLRFDSKLTRLSIAVECTAPRGSGLDAPLLQELKGIPKPTEGSLSALTRAEGSDRYVASATWTNIEPPEDSSAFSYTVVLPKAGSFPLLALEKDEEDEKSAYFALSCMPRIHAAPEEAEPSGVATPVNHVGVYWDTSLSRDPKGPGGGGDDRAIELKLIQTLIRESLALSHAQVRVSFLPFSVDPDGITVFTFKEATFDATWTELTKFVDVLDYDGGSNLSGLTFPRALQPDAPSVDVYLLFSDGFITLGTETPAAAQAPVFTANASTKTNAPLLKVFAEASGGVYFNRGALTDPATAVKSILEPSFQYIGAEIDGSIVEIFPSRTVSLSEAKNVRFTLVGRVKADSKLTLRYGKSRKTNFVHSFALSPSNANKSTGLVARQWAQHKINELNAFPEMNKDKILELGKKFSIVTGSSSFVVLEKLEDYVKYKVVPPKTREAIHREYVNTQQREAESENARRQRKLQFVQGLLSTRKSWHSRTFDLPAPTPVPEPGSPIIQESLSLALSAPSPSPSPSPIPAPTPPAPAPPPTLPSSPPEQKGFLSRLLNRASRSLSPSRGSSSPPPSVSSSAVAAPSLGGDSSSSLRLEDDEAPVMREERSLRSEERSLRSEDAPSLQSISASSSSIRRSRPAPAAVPAAAPSRGAAAPAAAPMAPMASAAPLAPPPSFSAPPPAPPPPSFSAPPPAPPPSSFSSASAAPSSAPSIDAFAFAESSISIARDMPAEMDCLDDAPREEKEQDDSASASASIPAPSAGGPGGGGGGEPSASIQVKMWDPSTPYLKKIETCPDLLSGYKSYLESRKDYRTSPSFYFDCASFFFSRGEVKSADPNIKLHGVKYGLRILTSVLELELDSPQLLRIVGYKLAELRLGPMAVSVFEKVLAIRGDEPQSPRDLAMVLAENKLDFERAITLFDKVLMGEWPERFREIELSALLELNALIHSPWGSPLFESLNGSRKQMGLPPIPDPSLICNLPVDLRIVMGWDTDMTDVDLHVFEPTGEDCYYSNKSTKIGGQMSRDFTQGYGPEEYSIKVAMAGKYSVRAKYFASHQQSLTGATTLLLYIYKFFGTPKQEREIVTLRLTSNHAMILVAEVDFQR